MAQRTLEADPRQTFERFFSLAQAQLFQAQRQVGPVAQCDQFGIGVPRLAETVEQQAALFISIVFDQRDAEVVARVEFPDRIRIHPVAEVGGLLILAIAEVEIGQQVFALGLDRGWQAIGNPCQQVERMLVMALVEAQPREVEPDPVLHRVRDLGGEQPREHLPRFLVQAVAIVEIGEQ